MVMITLSVLIAYKDLGKVANFLKPAVLQIKNEDPDSLK